MALRQSKRISELTALTSASLDTTIVGVDNGTTYKIELDVLADSVSDRINIGDRNRLNNLETYTASFSSSLNTSQLNSYTASQNALNAAFTNGINARLYTSSFNDFSTSVNSRIIAATNEQSFAGLISGSSQLTSSYDTRYETRGRGIISGSSQLTSLATTGSNTFNGNETISGSLFVSGTTELGGNIVPKSARGATLGTLERPFSEIFVSSGSINIASDTPGDPNTTLTNIGGNILVSAGGMRLVGDASFIAVTGSFQYLSGSFTHIGAQFNQGGIVTTGSLQVSGSTVMIGNNTMQGNTLLSGSFGITGSTSFSELGNTSLLSFSSSLNSRIISATNEQNLTNLVTTSSFNSYTASISTGSLVTSITNLNNATSSYETKGRSIISSSAQITSLGFVSGSYLTSLSGAISSSSQLTSSFDTRYTLSGSVQPLPSNLLSSSAQITAFGFISASGAIPDGTISGSAQITALGFISSSTTINTGSFATTGSNVFTGSQNISGSVTASAFLGTIRATNGVVSSSVQVLGGSGVYSGSLYAAGARFSLQDIVLGVGTTQGIITTDNKPIWIRPGGITSNTTATFWNTGTGGLTIGNIPVGSVFTYAGLALDVSGSTRYTGNISVTGSVFSSNGFTGSIAATNGVISGSLQITTLGFISSSTPLTSLNTFTASNDNTSLNTFTGSVVLTSSFNSYTASISTASLVSSITNLNTFTASNANTSLNAATSSYETIGRNIISGSSQITSLGFVSASVTASSIVSASSTTNVILFTKGDGTTTQVTVATGSATFVTSSFGTFHDTTTQSGSANTAYVMKLNSVDHQDGVILSGSGGIKILQAGTYDIEFSAQLSNGAGEEDVDIWLRKNGTNVDDSNTRLTIASNKKVVAAWNWQDTANPNDVFEIMWSSTSGNSTITAFGTGTSPTRPAIPSVIATIHRIDVGGGSNMISNTQFNPFTSSINSFTSSINTWTSSLSAIGTLNVDYINAGRITSDQSVGVNNDIVFNTTIANGGIPLNTSTGVFTLTANKTYRIFAGLSFNTFSDATNGYIVYDWVDATTNTSLDTTGVSVGVGEAINRNVSEFNATSANLIYTPSTNQTIKLRVVGASGTAYIRAGIGTKAIIEQINPSVALNQFATLQVSGSLSVTGSLTTKGNATIGTGSGAEGGQIDLATAQTGNTSLTGSTISLDVYGDKVRIFESAGTNKGAYLNVASQSAGVGSSIVTSPNLLTMQTITSASYAALTPVSGTLYIIIG
jgi:hypothetical protein